MGEVAESGGIIIMNNKKDFGDIRNILPKVTGTCPNCYADELYEIPKMRNGVHGIICVNCEEITYDSHRKHPSFNMTGVFEK